MWIVDPRDRVADWELGPTAAVQHHKRGRTARIAGAGEDPDLTFGVQFLVIVYHFCTIVKLKNCRWRTDCAHKKNEANTMKSLESGPQADPVCPPPVHPGSQV